MNIENQKNEINRRRFLLTGVQLATLGMAVALGTSSKLFGNVGEMEAGKIGNVVLNNGIKMPVLGFGTFGLQSEICQQSVADAILLGYRLLDTAKVYGNEEAVGKGIRQSGIDRKKLFVTSKLWVDDSGYENAKKGFENTLAKLGLEYLDLYLIHRPRGDVKGSWKAMEELYRAGKIKAIGVSNFEPAQLKDLMSYAQVNPAVNQIETHAYFQENDAHEALKQHHVQMQAWAPFAEGRNNLFTNQTLVKIAQKHKKTVAQVSLRWHYQRGIISIPRSSQNGHRRENLDIFDFKLDADDLKTIAQLDLNRTQFPEWS